jgi:hypothetical protein
MGLLKDAEGNLRDRFVCDGTSLLPTLQGKRWPRDDEVVDENCLPAALQVAIRRARIRVEILGQETDPHTKYELFQRLNTGGVSLSEQEVRNCVIIAVNKPAFDVIRELSLNDDFVSITDVGRNAVERQFRPELVVRFVVMRHRPYTNGMDVHEYLDKGIVEICADAAFDWRKEAAIFAATMSYLRRAAGDTAFKKNNRFSLGFYEFIALGLSKAIERNDALISDAYIVKKVKQVNDIPEAQTYTGIGIRGTQRLSRFVMPLSERHFTTNGA